MPCGQTRFSGGMARNGPSVSTSSSHARCSSAGRLRTEGAGGPHQREPPRSASAGVSANTTAAAVTCGLTSRVALADRGDLALLLVAKLVQPAAIVSMSRRRCRCWSSGKEPAASCISALASCVQRLVQVAAERGEDLPRPGDVGLLAFGELVADPSAGGTRRRRVIESSSRVRSGGLRLVPLARPGQRGRPRRPASACSASRAWSSSCSAFASAMACGRGGGRRRGTPPRAGAARPGRPAPAG